ncbi:MAG TPA: hypothetical protein PKE64_19660 [Anaerolineae bacterium]|nr:hypothetical protein [Anaerolineae bacterium]HMR66234.1 hypothetical protein [Anaerolineae bacterium]
MVAWEIAKKTGSDMWDEMLYMIVLNLIWLVGTVLIIPWPFVTFGLFYTVKNIGDGHGIKLGTLFSHGRQTLKPAYIWGGINFSILVAMYFNLQFYAGIQAEWTSFLRLFLLSLGIFWGIFQLVMLALYPRLVRPSFRLALRNAAVITGRHPLAIFTLMIIVGLILGITPFFPAIPLLISFAFIALLTNNVIQILVDRELARMEEPS